VKPVKRAGGRRYYRPQDVELLRQIQRLLHDDGYTIKGVQKVLKSARGVASAIEKAREVGVETAADEVTGELVEAVPAVAAVVPMASAAEGDQKVSKAMREALQQTLSELKSVRTEIDTLLSRL